MVEIQKINWTKKALKDYINALEYWTDRNNNKRYAEKLISIVHKKVRLIKDFPGTGKETSKENYRYVLVRDYLLIYKLQEETITIMRFWHGKQDSKKVVYFKESK